MESQCDCWEWTPKKSNWKIEEIDINHKKLTQSWNIQIERLKPRKIAQNYKAGISGQHAWTL